MRDRKFVKLRVDMYEDTKFKIIDRMEERDVIHYIWTRLLALAGKVNLEGKLYMSKNIPYTVETLSIEFNRSTEKIQLALNVFKDLEMVELTESNVYKIRNFAKHQNIKVKEKIENKDNNIEFNDKENLSNQKLENKEYMEEEFNNIATSIDRKDKIEEEKDLENKDLKNQDCIEKKSKKIKEKKIKNSIQNINDNKKNENKENIKKKDLDKQVLKENEKISQVLLNAKSNNPSYQDVDNTFKEESEKKFKSEDKLKKEKKIIEFKNSQSENTILNNIDEQCQNKQLNSNKELEFSEDLLVDNKKKKKTSKKNKKTKNSVKKDIENDNDIFKIDDDDCLGEMCDWEENPKIEGEVVKFFSF
ncbi:phage replisome organizer N-terminal domain-containing protein [Clostridium weizhouense]|uniref:Phage replisome organizer N-terminal domain-containing protein n=1 Tax=Clostridium weizhouense TaxID=2859781 RepID=A0ABS7ALX8_9CLOT|nr:phage replisome organizer N-terminal domain-containing protein [Clostridium weizhouense]MBW6409657.1 phage replisome organizer N-terminal domain-containing protein [Clostridium weizhouense]